jgi:hypothetical protein
MWYSKLFFIVCCLLTATQLQAAKKVTPKGETKVVNGVSIQATWYSDDIVRIVKGFSRETMEQEARRNFEQARHYQPSELERKIDDFFALLQRKVQGE